MRAFGLWPAMASGLSLIVLASACRDASPPVAPETAVAARPAETSFPAGALASRSLEDPPMPSLAPVVDAPAGDATETLTPAGASPAASPAVPDAPLASYPPRDECAKLPGFTAFRDKLFAAAKARDADTLVALADPKIHLDFGGGAGRDELRKRLGDPKAGLWAAIGKLPGLGCAADADVATMPWIFARLPEGFDDASTAMYGLGPDVALFTGPSATKPVRTLAWPVLSLADAGLDTKARLTRVRASGSVAGYVETARLRSLLDYRLVAARQGDGWTITALIAGD